MIGLNNSPRARGLSAPLTLTLLAVLLACGGLPAYGFDGFIKMKDGYYYDTGTGKPFVPHGIAYQTWNRPLGVWQTHDQIDYDLDEMVKMGANSIRVDFVWQHIEEDGDNQFKWDNYDYLVQAAEQRGLRIFALIGYQWPPNWFPDAWYTQHPPEYDSGGIYHPTRWASDIINYEHPQARAQYAEWFSNVCGRYKDAKAIAGWIVGNESGYLGLWSGLLDGYDPESESAFRTWCQTKYGTISNCNAAWGGTTFSSFSNIVFVEKYREYGTEGAEWADMVQWREDSIGSFTALGAKAAKAADTNHLISYSTVGMQWGEEDWRYHAEDRGKITAACIATNAPIDFFSVNNYPWSILGHESQNGRWGVTYTKKVAHVPVLYSETGFTSSETMWPGMNEARQGPLIRNSLWESLDVGAIGTHIFAWHDRPYITDREKGFGILYSDRNVKPAFWVSRDCFNLMEQSKIHDLLAGSKDRKPDIAFLWTAANDSQYNRYECEMQQIGGALMRLGFEPYFMNLDDLAAGAYTNYRVIVLPRNMRVDSVVPGSGKGVLKFLRENVIASGVHILASADLPGMQNQNGLALPEYTNELALLFGIDASDPGGFEVAPRSGNYIASNMVPLRVQFNVAIGNLTNGYTCTPTVWKYNDEVRVTDGTAWGTFDAYRNKGFEDTDAGADGWWSWGAENLHIQHWFPMEGTNMLQISGPSGIFQDFPVVQAGRYTASTYLRSNPDDPIRGGACAKLAIEWRDPLQNVIGTVEATPLYGDTAGSWVQYKIDAIAPSNAQTGRRVIRYDHTTNFPDLLVNGALSGSGTAPTGWSAWNDGNHDPDAGTYRSAANAWAFWWDSGMWQDVTAGFKPGDTVKFGGWFLQPVGDALRNGKQGTIELELYNGGTKLGVWTASPPLSATSPTGSWVQSEGTVTVPSGATLARILIRCNASGDGRFLVDDVYFRSTTPGGSAYVDNRQTSPALVVKNHGTAKAAIFLFSAGDMLPDGDRDGEMDIHPWKWRYDYIGAVVKDYFGIQPIVEVKGTNAFLCLAEYRTCADSSTLWQVKNYMYDRFHTNQAGGYPQTFTISSSLFSNKNIRGFEQGRIFERNSDGTIDLTLVPDGQEILHVYPAVSNDYVCQLSDAPSVIHPFGDKNYTLKVKYDTAGKTNLILKIALVGGKYTNKTYQVIATNIVGTGEQTFYMWIPDFNSGDTNYLSTVDGGSYRFDTWLEDPATNAVTIVATQPTELKWGTRPTSTLPAVFNKGSTTNISLKWEELYEQLYWQHCPMARNDSFPTRIAVYRSKKTEAQFPGHFAKVNEVCDWLESLGYVNGELLDLSFDNVMVTTSVGSSSAPADLFADSVESGTNGWSGSGLWHIASDLSSSPTRSWAYNNGVNYSTGGRTTGALVSAWINLTNGAGATLTFRSWYETEDTGTSWDKKQVFISTDGTNWTPVLDVAGLNKQWVPQTFDLSPYAGRSIRVKFAFDSIDGVYNTFRGWYVDDIRVQAAQTATITVYSNNVEAGTNGWTSAGLWHIAKDLYSSASNSWAYNNGTTYNTGSRNSGTLISPWIDVTNGNSVTLTFRSWHQTEDAGTAWDRKQLYVTVDGTNWAQLLQVSGPLTNQWLTQTASLALYAGRRIQLKFLFDTLDGLNNGFRGWYIDDIRITAEVAVEDGYTAFGDSMESGTNSWAVDGLWHQAADLASSPTHSWAYNNGSNYNTGARNSGSLVTPWIDLSAASAAAVSFKSWYETEDTAANWDRKIVYISTNGTSWSQLLQVSGANKQWTAQGCDLGAYAGQRIKLKFFFDSIDGQYNAFRGWYVDDVRVSMIASGVLFFDDFSGVGNWTRVAGCGNWETNSGALRAWRIGNDDNIVSAGSVWTNYSVSADIRYNRQGKYFNDAEVYVRFIDRNNFVKVLIENFYGFWRLKYVVRMDTNNCSQGWISEFTKATRPVEGPWYNLKVTAQGTNYAVFFDGAPVGSFSSPSNFPYVTGRIALGSKAPQLGIWEPQKGYFFIDDDEYSYYTSATIGSPLDLDWGYLSTFFGTLILPSVYAMNDKEASNVVAWVNHGTFSIIATDGGIASRDETGSSDLGRVESVFGVSPTIGGVNGLTAMTIGTNDHYVTLDYSAGNQVALAGNAQPWTTLTTGVGLGTLNNGSVSAPGLIAAKVGPDAWSPSKVVCFNFGADTHGQLTNQFRRLAQRAFEWTRGQASKIRIDLKYPNPSGNPNYDITVGTVIGWALAGSGTTNFIFTLPEGGIMTGDNLYWSIYVYPWDSAYPWGDHAGYYSSANDGFNVSIPGKGLQVIGCVDPVYAGRAWGLWLAYNTRGEPMDLTWGVKDKGNLLVQDNFDDGNSSGWSKVPATNYQWAVTADGRLSCTSAPRGGYSMLMKDGLNVADTNVTIEYDVIFTNGATGGGIVYRGYPLYINPDGIWWSSSDSINFQSPTNFSGVITNADGSLVYVVTGSIFIYIGPSGLTSNQWHHIAVSIRDGDPTPHSDIYVDGVPQILADPLPGTNWTSTNVGFLGPYTNGCVRWDNFRVSDELYSFVSQTVNGEFVETNVTVPVFWATAPDYDPAMWEHEGTTLGGKYEWYAFFRGTNVQATQDAHIYFAPRLMVEDTNFPVLMSKGQTVQLPVEWENLPTSPVMMKLSLEYPYESAYQHATTIVSRIVVITQTCGSAYFDMTLPSDVPAGDGYLWAAYMYPSNSPDPMNGRIGLDDTFRFTTNGPITWYPRETKVEVTAVTTNGDVSVFSDAGIPVGSDIMVWGADSWYTITSPTAYDGGFESHDVGVFPTGGYWTAATSGGGCGGVINPESAQTGSHGLWCYTGSETWSYWWTAYQEFTAYEGDRFRCSAWVRQPTGEWGTWVSGSRAHVRMNFLNASHVSLLMIDSTNAVTTDDQGWTLVTTPNDVTAAPRDTAYMRFELVVEKPNGASGVSVANFDDCTVKLGNSFFGDFAGDPSPPEGAKCFRSTVLSWSGWGVFYKTNDMPQGADFSAFANGYLKFWLKTPGYTRIELQDMSGNQPGYPAGPSYYYGPTMDGEGHVVWQEKTIAITNFTAQGLDLYHIRSPFMGTDPIDTTVPFTFMIDNVRWTLTP